ncbi:F-BAR and double SH3 domains protein 1 [Xenopus tropicalis]|uniref:F-BAR and double SH3 domains protein 1 n=2 Tax=Xenopus tropicalis TaxID=8364 RepID=A0A8J0QWQ6_XENTR|nr:F-BAR and double SH3 domains protein 1 [Xenopus tropicalis]
MEGALYEHSAVTLSNTFNTFRAVGTQRFCGNGEAEVSVPDCEHLAQQERGAEDFGMQPPPRKVKATQEVKVRFGEQLSSLQNKQLQDTELLEDIRSFCKQRAAIEKEYGQALQRLASQYLKRDWHRGKNETSECRSVYSVWRSVVEGTASIGQTRVTGAENYRNLTSEAAKTARSAKELLLKKSIEQLLKVQNELLETMKEVNKTKKRYVQLERVSEVAKEKAMDTEARLKKSEHSIFHSKASLQKLSAKFSTQVVECNQQLSEARNEYLLALTAANAHLNHYYQTHLPDIMTCLDGDIYDRLCDYLTLISNTELNTCKFTQERFKDILVASQQVSRQQNLQLFLKDTNLFSPTLIQKFQPAGSDKMSTLESLTKGPNVESVLDKEARRWTSRAARDYKLKTHGERVLQRLEAKRATVSEDELSSMELKTEEVKESVRKAEVSKVKADARVELLRQVGVDVDMWLTGAMMQANAELEQERRMSEARMSNGELSPTMDEFDFTDFEECDDNGEIFEESSLNLSGSRPYPFPCQVLYSYQSSQSDELSITQGEQLEVIEDGDVEEWVKARNKSGQVGYVPERYITIINHSAVNQKLANWTETSHKSGANSELSGILGMDWAQTGVCLARALYEYEGQSEEELTFPEGAIIQIIRKEEGGVDDGFWKGEFNGRVGVFPSLVVEELSGEASGTSEELPSPAPPSFLPPTFAPFSNQTTQPPAGAAADSSTDPRHNGSQCSQGSPDFAATRLRPMRAAPPPPTKPSETGGLESSP